ncbi:SCO family protein [Maioricimonas sp. JC845]|uniref:SCO family protein n=1 Tax=Maioricimonas sp. JC845 TaxID=3232138 RepID=UPI00345885CD
MRTPSTDIRRLLPLLVAAACLLTGRVLPAQIAKSIDALEGVGVEEHLNAVLPLDEQFTNDTGRSIRLQELFDGERPVILSLNYSNCPMLCSLQLNGLIEALHQVQLNVGDDFQLVSVSIDPLETTIRARETKQRYMKDYGRPGTGHGWHFLTGRKDSIDRLAESVGFGYEYIPERKEYAHAAVFMICTPDGRISRYIYGVRFDPQTVRLSLVEAADGKIGTTLDQVLLYCFHYDATAGSYAATAVSIMKVGGGVTVVALLAGLVPWWFRRRRSASVDPSSSEYSPA